MLTIPCPWCGDRHESEFFCGGAYEKARPARPETLSDEAWVDYVTVSPNPAGPLAERWWHRRGCGLWFFLERDTLTHDIRPLSDGEDHEPH